MKDRIPHVTVFPQFIQLQIATGDKVLEQHINESPSNAQHTSTFSITAMIDTWVERRSLESLKSSPFFSTMADKCYLNTGITFNLLLLDRDCCPEEHFLIVIHVKSTDDEEITHAYSHNIHQ